MIKIISLDSNIWQRSRMLNTFTVFFSFFLKQGLNGDLGAREILIGELRAAAEPLRESCAAEVRERVDAAVNEAVQAWDDTRAELDALCTRYQHACRLWQQYRDSSAAVKAWVDTQMNSVVNLPPEEAVKQVKVSNKDHEPFFVVIN